MNRYMRTNNNVKVSDVYTKVESKVLAIGELLLKEKPKMTDHQYTYTTDLIKKELGLDAESIVSFTKTKKE